jgi:GxxExxY protein
MYKDSTLQIYIFMRYGTATLKRHAERVLKALGKGHSESVYHKAIIASLNADGVPHRSEVIAPILFLGQVVGMGRCDLIVGNMIIEFKATTKPPQHATDQIAKYLTALSEAERKQYYGVVVNFNQKTGRVDIFQSKPTGMLNKIQRGIDSNY